MTPISKLCPGVKPLPGDYLVYEVRSKSRKDVWHRVDFTAQHGWGECGCETCQMRIAKAIADGAPLTRELECLHITLARRYMAIEAAQGAIVKRIAETNEIRKKNKSKPYLYDPSDRVI